MAFNSHIIAITDDKNLQNHEKYGTKHKISPDFGYFCNILTLPSIKSVGKRNGGFKISSQYRDTRPTDPSLAITG